MEKIKQWLCSWKLDEKRTIGAKEIQSNRVQQLEQASHQFRRIDGNTIRTQDASDPGEDHYGILRQKHVDSIREESEGYSIKGSNRTWLCTNNPQPIRRTVSVDSKTEWLLADQYFQRIDKKPLEPIPS
ncbi:hypothetical protein AYI68_g911, partial [Smittium mucronatum]